MMGLSYEQAVSLGIGHLHPDAAPTAPKPSAPDPVPTARPVPAGDGLNKLERRFRDDILRPALDCGGIVGFRRGPFRVRLGGRTSYLPDWLVIEPEIMTIVEVKGFMRDDAAVKIKVAADLLPWFRWLLVTHDLHVGWIAHQVDSRGIGINSMYIPWIHT